MYEAAFIVGWNDTAHGIITWKPGCSATYPTPEAWAKNMKTVARDCREQNGSNSHAYYTGVMACVDAYIVAGAIAKKPTPAVVT